MTKYTELITEIRELLQERTEVPNSGGMFLDVEILHWIKRNIIELASDTLVNYALYEYEVPVGASILTLPLETITGGLDGELIRRSFVGYIPVGKTDLFELEIINPLDVYLTSTLLKASVFKGRLNFNQAVPAGTKIILAGNWVPILTGEDYPLDTNCEDATILYCLRNGYLKKEKEEVAASYFTLYKDRKGWITSNADDTQRASDQGMKANRKTSYVQPIGSIDPNA